MRHLLTRTVLATPWRAEAAAMLSQVGCLALTPELLRAAHRGLDLSAEEQARFDGHAARAGDLLGHIPRMDAVAWIVRNQMFGMADDPLPAVEPDEIAELRLAAEMLRLALGFDTLWLRGMPHAAIVFETAQGAAHAPHGPCWKRWKP